ncbi:MAG: NusG domain II-containing protein [Pseudomonadota bacterium]|nr:NusG domain II-containing protein [Pseudomonadota bacterium]
MTRADWLLIVIVVCSLPLLYARLWLQDDTVSYLRVQTGNEAATVMPLRPDRRLDIKGPLGDSTVEIRDKQVRFLSSPCAGKVCIHSGWLSAAGELAACLPNRISIQLLGTHPRFDAINF